MNLQDYIRSNTQETSDVLRKMGERQAELVSERKAAEERIKRIGTEITRQQDARVEKRHKIAGVEQRLGDVNRELDEIEKKRSALLGEVTLLQNAILESKEFFVELDRADNEFQREINGENTAIQRTDQKIDALEADRQRHESRFREAQLKAFKAFLKDVNGLIGETYGNATARRASIESRERLRRSRHEDREVGDLCDARDEWRRILKSVGVPSVAQAAEIELRRIESEIERRFPGAMELESMKSNGQQITELYFHAGDDWTMVYLPFSEEDWRSAAIETGPSTETFMYFVWWLSGKMKVGFDDVVVKCENGLVVLCSKVGLGDLKGVNDMVFSIPGDNGITFILSQIPYEVKKAIDNENLN